VFPCPGGLLLKSRYPDLFFSKLIIPSKYHPKIDISVLDNEIVGHQVSILEIENVENVPEVKQVKIGLATLEQSLPLRLYGLPILVSVSW